VYYINKCSFTKLIINFILFSCNETNKYTVNERKVFMKGIIVVFVIIVGLIACEKSSNQIDLSTTTDSVNIAVNSCIERLYSSNIRIKYCFDSLLQDYRCPYNAMCIWEGYAKARFTVSINNLQHTIELYTPNVQSNFKADTIISGIHIRLENVTPENGDPSSTYDDYKAILKVVGY
jgi:hypothetical protein